MVLKRDLPEDNNESRFTQKKRSLMAADVQNFVYSICVYSLLRRIFNLSLSSNDVWHFHCMIFGLRFKRQSFRLSISRIPWKIENKTTLKENQLLNNFWTKKFMSSQTYRYSLKVECIDGINFSPFKAKEVFKIDILLSMLTFTWRKTFSCLLACSWKPLAAVVRLIDD